MPFFRMHLPDDVGMHTGHYSFLEGAAFKDSFSLHWEAVFKGKAILLSSADSAGGAFSRDPTRVLFFVLNHCISMPGYSLFLTTVSWLIKDMTFTLMIHPSRTTLETHLLLAHIVLQEQKLW